VQGQSVAHEVARVVVQAELGVHLGHGRRVRVHVLPRLGVVLVKVLESIIQISTRCNLCKKLKKCRLYI
jgi:hypothetical protein